MRTLIRAFAGRRTEAHSTTVLCGAGELSESIGLYEKLIRRAPEGHERGIGVVDHSQPVRTIGHGARASPDASLSSGVRRG